MKEIDIENLEVERYLEDLCVQYVNGSYISWEDFLYDNKHNKVSLPPYSFVSRKFWVDFEESIRKIQDTTEAKKINTLDFEKIFKIFLSGRKDGRYTKTEIILALMYNKYLGFTQININDDFFEIGGDSIILISILNELNHLYDDKIKIGELIQHSTIEAAGKYIDQILEG